MKCRFLWGEFNHSVLAYEFCKIVEAMINVISR